MALLLLMQLLPLLLGLGLGAAVNRTRIRSPRLHQDQVDGAHRMERRAAQRNMKPTSKPANLDERPWPASPATTKHPNKTQTESKTYSEPGLVPRASVCLFLLPPSPVEGYKVEPRASVARECSKTSQQRNLTPDTTSHASNQPSSVPKVRPPGGPWPGRSSASGAVVGLCDDSIVIPSKSHHCIRAPPRPARTALCPTAGACLSSQPKRSMTPTPRGMMLLLTRLGSLDPCRSRVSIHTHPTTRDGSGTTASAPSAWLILMAVWPPWPAIAC
ncbi:hypothetical protein BGZ61DRAFT_476091 [Ilyonectria robusta]|uniref:uncharacterized protein n=1 Tax=Ilyonectria robusta TaxID=1079257 RepID=UPI001E8EAB30|nr:uncharacterized protein BGZ61DRAFT_476091 [Ilyonectria robusta]KAH8722190.1 hypothetical protein BGZ61DRAFT_476091 [Ilyonectria robusta]